MLGFVEARCSAVPFIRSLASPLTLASAGSDVNGGADAPSARAGVKAPSACGTLPRRDRPRAHRAAPPRRSRPLSRPRALRVPEPPPRVAPAAPPLARPPGVAAGSGGGGRAGGGEDARAALPVAGADRPVDRGPRRGRRPRHGGDARAADDRALAAVAARRARDPVPGRVPGQRDPVAAGGGAVRARSLLPAP